MGRKSTDKNRKQNDEKKQQWALQAFPLFQMGNLHGLTIDDIAKWLGKSKSTLYEYFESKDEIILLGLLERFRQLMGYKEILLDDKRAHTQRYSDFLAFMLPQIKDISAQFLVELKRDFPAMWTIAQAFLGELLGLLGDYHLSGIQAKAFKPLSAELMVKMDSLFISEVLMQPDFLLQHGLSLSQLVEQYLVMKFEGIVQR